MAGHGLQAPLGAKTRDWKAAGSASWLPPLVRWWQRSTGPAVFAPLPLARRPGRLPAGPSRSRCPAAGPTAARHGACFRDLPTAAAGCSALPRHRPSPRCRRWPRPPTPMTAPHRRSGPAWRHNCSSGPELPSSLQRRHLRSSDEVGNARRSAHRCSIGRESAPPGSPPRSRPWPGNRLPTSARRARGSSRMARAIPGCPAAGARSAPDALGRNGQCFR